MTQILLRMLAASLIVGGVSAQQRPRDAELDVQLRTAMNLELVKGDLTAAIAEYKRIADAAGASRAIAARALLQLAQSYEKQGDPEARATYERITRDYPDQRAIVDQARARAAALAQTAAAATTGAPARRLLVDHKTGPYGRPTRDGKGYLRYNEQQRAFELLDLPTGRVRRLATDGPAAAEGVVSGASLQLSNDGRRIAATVHVYVPGTESASPRPIDRAELRVFDVGGRGPGRALASWPWNDLIRFSARTFAWSPRNDRIWLKVMFKGGAAQIVSVDLSGARQTVKGISRDDHSQPPSLSPDGRFITYHDAVDPQTPPDVMILAADGSRELRLEHPANDNKPVFTPDGSGIVFESNRRGARDLWFVPVADGRPAGDARLAWRDLGAFGQIERFADNGALSYYFASNDYAVSTVAIDLDGGRAVIGDRAAVPAMLGEMNSGAAFSPDGRQLLFFRARGRRVAVQELASGRVREIPLPAELGSNATADWCPGGDQVIVTGYINIVGTASYLVDVREAQVQRLALQDPSSAVCLGRDVAYLRVDAGGQSISVMRRSLDTGTETKVLTEKDGPCGCVRTIARSSDGSRLALIGREPTRSRVLAVDAAGGPVRELMTAGAAIDGQMSLIQNVAWMPDGRRLLVVRFDEEFAGAKGQTQRPLWLWEVPVDGGAARRLGRVPVSNVDGYFSGISSLTVRPDGRAIAYQSHEGYVEQTWAIENLAQSIKTSARDH